MTNKKYKIQERKKEELYILKLIIYDSIKYNLI